MASPLVFSRCRLLGNVASPSFFSPSTLTDTHQPGKMSFEAQSIGNKQKRNRKHWRTRRWFAGKGNDPSGGVWSAGTRQNENRRASAGEKKKRGPAKRWHVAGFGRRLFSASDVAAHVRGRPASRRGVCGAARPPNSTGAAGGPSDAAGTAGRHPTDGQRAKIQRRKFRRNGVEKWRDVLGGVAPSRGNVSTARKFASAFVRFLLDSRIISTSRQQRY